MTSEQQSFLDFVVNRHAIWECRQLGLPQPWTQDPILASKKFTNVFRILDPGTQFLMTDLFDGEWDLWRAFLYQHTGRIETWKLVLNELGEYPTPMNLDVVREIWLDYQQPFFTNAYLVYPQSSVPGTNKIDSIIDLVQRVFTADFSYDWHNAPDMQTRFGLLRINKGVGDFMSMQVLTDWGYTLDVDHEDDWVRVGPGAIKGAKIIDRGVAWAHRAVKELENCPTILDGRKPSLMDVQNCLCEFSKYWRYQQQEVSTDKPYEPAHSGPQPDPVYPLYYH